jgi:hypothetical protein
MVQSAEIISKKSGDVARVSDIENKELILKIELRFVEPVWQTAGGRG